MAIRRAHMATYPARLSILERSVCSIALQVDEVHLVLNEFSEIPAFLGRISNLNAILPDEDWKDVGKFLMQPAPDDHVFLVDDDLHYSARYCDWITSHADSIGLDRNVFGLHACIYRPAKPVHSRSRKTLHFRAALRYSQYVDQIGTGTAFALGKNIPPLDAMRDARRFVDVRYARWCFENGLSQIALARPFHMLHSIRHGGETIYQEFTAASPKHVADEICVFAGQSPGIGNRVGPALGFLELLRAP